MHLFKDKLDEGEKYERELDRYYSKWFKIESVNLATQKMGIDRIFINKSDDTRWTIEYKSDTKASTTGNAFVETISVNTTKKPGWAYSSCAQLLLYYLPLDGKVIRLTMYAVKNLITEWIKKYPVKPSQNEDYQTLGICVPLDVFTSYGQVDYLNNPIVF